VNTFNLTFWGEILPGRDPKTVKARFAKLFDIRDAQRLEHFFSGEQIILRRNLDRKVAAEYYAKLRKLGVETALVKVGAESSVSRATAIPEPDPADTGDQWEEARRKAELEVIHRARQDAAARQREAEERQRLEAERAEQERQFREQQAELDRQRYEEQARREAARAEQQRERAQAAARKQRQQEAQRQRKAEQAARRKAEKERARQAREAEAARARAAAEESKRREAEEKARRQAELAEERRRKAEQLAREKARARAEAEQRKAEAESRQREEAARLEAERDAQHRRKAEIAAQRKAELAAARQEAERQLARKKAEAAERKRLREAAAAQERAQREARLRDEQEQRLAERQQLEEQAINRGAAALNGTARTNRRPARVRSGMDLPRRETSSSAPARRRQAGAPNDYQARPFRNTTEVRERAQLAAQQMRRSLGIATLMLAVTLLLLGHYLGTPSAAAINGPDAVAAAPGGRLAVLAGERLFLHDRAGIGRDSLDAATLGFSDLAAPMAYEADGQLLLWATPGSTKQAPVLQRCDLARRSCQAVGDMALPGRAALQVHTLSGQLFFVNGDARQVRKLDSNGTTRATVTLPMAPRPVLRVDAGLMFINSHEGPAISVRRYEDGAFGQQLDEVLLLPPAAMDKGQVSVFDFARVGDYWWASMVNPDTGDAGLYVFDSAWKYLREIELPASHLPARLEAWGQRLLIPSPTSPRILRFSAAGGQEADYRSDLLDAAIADHQWRAQWQALAWSTVFALCLVLVGVSLAFTYWQRLRNLVFRARPTRGAEPLDQYTAELDWVDPAGDRSARLRGVAVGYAVLCLATVLLCAGLGASALLMSAVLIALAGPAVALYLYARGAGGHAGVTGDTLALVDHRNMYHLASDARIHYRGPFVSIDDVVVFTGNALLPAMDPDQVNAKLRPVVEAGARVDRKTILVKLLEVRHPLALGALAIAGSLLAAISVLIAGTVS
jgi:hypothetical protein